MTVAVAIICEEGQTGVLATDMALTISSRIQVERGYRKIIPLGEQVLVAWAGDKLQADWVMQRLRAAETELASAGPLAVAERVATEREALREELHRRLVPELKALLVAFGSVPDPQASALISSIPILKTIEELIANCTISASFLVLGRERAGTAQAFHGGRAVRYRRVS